MLSGKQKRFLRGLGSTQAPILFIGKGEINQNIINQLEEALDARELVKVRVLKNCMLSVEEVAEELVEKTGSELVQIIGHNFLVYRPSDKEVKIELPD